MKGRASVAATEGAAAATAAMVATAGTEATTATVAMVLAVTVAVTVAMAARQRQQWGRISVRWESAKLHCVVWTNWGTPCSS